MFPERPESKPSSNLFFESAITGGIVKDSKQQGGHLVSKAHSYIGSENTRSNCLQAGSFRIQAFQSFFCDHTTDQICSPNRLFVLGFSVGCLSFFSSLLCSQRFFSRIFISVPPKGIDFPIDKQSTLFNDQFL